ncbi:MAG: type II toxin-antitoxin system PemK/MazF family toxin [Dehalococcoidia bacterium]|nr:type II toxin-antitoxin system PemK/MazF family toxin [Dehalococcoidia bacterium]
MTRYSRGDVVLVPFPFTGLDGVKRRPALVISGEEYNSAGEVLVGQITSKVKTAPRPGDHRIRHWQRAGLIAPSLFRCRVATLAAPLIIRKLGKMGSVDMQAVDGRLREVLGLQMRTDS